MIALHRFSPLPNFSDFCRIKLNRNPSTMPPVKGARGFMLYESQIGKGDLELDPLMCVSYLASKSLDLDEVLPETLVAIAELIPAGCLTIVQRVRIIHSASARVGS